MQALLPEGSTIIPSEALALLRGELAGGASERGEASARGAETDAALVALAKFGDAPVGMDGEEE
jgi:hypothetical protein